MVFSLALNTPQDTFIQICEKNTFFSDRYISKKRRILIMDGANAVLQQIEQPLLENEPKPPKTPAQKAIRKSFKISAHLANLLPTGSVLTFQVLSPAFTHQGQCQTIISRTMTLGLLALCCFLSFILRFTDSFRDARGKVRYGLATSRGLWVIDGSVKMEPEEAEKYRLKFIDFFHAFMSVLVFVAVAMFDKNIVKCFCPTPSPETKELLVTLPIGIGIACSVLFVALPTKRHGIGFPLSRN